MHCPLIKIVNHTCTCSYFWQPINITYYFIFEYVFVLNISHVFQVMHCEQCASRTNNTQSKYSIILMYYILRWKVWTEIEHKKILLTIKWLQNKKISFYLSSLSSYFFCVRNTNKARPNKTCHIDRVQFAMSSIVINFKKSSQSC